MRKDRRGAYERGAMGKVSGSTGWYRDVVWAGHTAGAAEHAQDGPVGHHEVLADHGERLTGFVQLASDRGVVITEAPLARLHASPSQEAEGRGPIDAELCCQRGRRFSREIRASPARIVANRPIGPVLGGAMGWADGTVGDPDQRESGADAPRCRGWISVPAGPHLL